MTSLHDRPNQALLAVDMQVGVVRDALEVEAVTSTISKLAGRARRADVLVVGVQDHSEDRTM